MEVRNSIPQSKFSFQARPSIPLRRELESSAITKRAKTLLKNKFKMIEQIGDKASEIGTSFDLNEGARRLSLFNKKLSSSYGGTLPMKKDSIYDSFMALEKEDILNAENEIRDIVSANKTALILKAAKDKETMIKIAGKPNPTDEEFAAAIEKLSEEEMINLRLGLEEPIPDTGFYIDFQF